MINLVKNELSKIFHKKGLYVFGIIILVMLVFDVIISKIDFNVDTFTTPYYKSLEEHLSDYDLNNESDIDYYIEDKNELDLYKISSNYDYESPERYFVEENLPSVIATMNMYKYKTKNEELYNQAKAEYDEIIAKLDNFDWKSVINEKKDSYYKELDTLKDNENSTESEKLDIAKQKNRIEIELECLSYRLEHDIPFAYTTASFAVDDYSDIAQQYVELNKDKDAVKTRKQETEENEIIARYNEAKYKMEHNLISNNQYDFNENLVIDVTNSKLYVFIAFLIIAGGIFAEEFNKGTIKQLLIKPYTRTQIFISKIIAAVLGTIIFDLFLVGAFILYEAVVTNSIGDIFKPVIVYNFAKETIAEYSVFEYLLIDMVATLPHYIILAGVCILMGVWFTNTVAAVISALGLQVFSGLVSLLPEQIQAFIPVRCWEFTEFLFGNVSTNQYVTLPLSITICVITIIILYGLALIIFKKKDIKNQ